MTKVAAALAISVSIFASISSATATYAAGASDVAPGKNKEALIEFYTTVEPTGSPTPGGEVKNLGGAISGGFYGNTSNAGIDQDAPDSGHGVTPSISPGPQVVGGGGPGTGTSIGELIQDQR
jgi:hypothetical protein